jgi:hypothetical protein
MRIPSKIPLSAVAVAPEESTSVPPLNTFRVTNVTRISIVTVAVTLTTGPGARQVPPTHKGAATRERGSAAIELQKTYQADTRKQAW